MTRIVRAATVAAAALLGATAPAAQAQQTPLSPRPLAVPPAANPPGPELRAFPPALPAPRPPEAVPRRPQPPPPLRPDAARPPPTVVADPAGLAQDLEAAVALDAASRAIRAQRDAIRARDALVRSPIPGAPVVGGAFRSDLRGPGTAREFDLEFAAPVWLPGQRAALAGTVEAGVEEAERRAAFRRLEMAGLLREAYWAVGSAESTLRVARDRLATARGIASDFARRAQLGDISETEALLGRNEVLAAELAVAAAEADLRTARAAYRTLTGGSTAALPAESVVLASVRAEAPAPPGPSPHPSLRAAEAALAAADARARLIAATPRDNPEVGLFARSQWGFVTEEGTSVGLRVRLPLATEARNAPRRAEAEADRTRAEAELAQARRVVEGGVTVARVALAAAETAVRLAAERRAVADRQLDAARRAFASGEIGAFDLFRVRQLQLEAVAVDAQARVEAGRARSRLNQALGATPGGS